LFMAGMSPSRPSRRKISISSSANSIDVSITSVNHSDWKLNS
jgi:hypothetical protein